MLATAWAEGEVCEINGTPYATLDAALAAVTDGQTIRLLAPIDYNQGISITDGRSIIFDLNGFNLNVTNSGGVGLTVTSGSIGYTGAGAFNVSGASFGLNVNGSSASATVTNATATFPGSYGANASNGGSITINNDVEGGYAGAYAFTANSTVVVSGDATGNDANSYGAYAQGGTITIGGNAQGELYGAYATGNGSMVTVQGNAIGTGASSFGAGAYQGGSVIIEGSAQGVMYGVNASGVVNSVKSSVVVLENVSASDEINGIGALAAAGGKITIDGTITAKKYIQLYLTVINGSPESRTIPTTKEGYYTYSDGFSIVWVRDTTSYVAEIDGIPYATMDEALDAVDNGQTIQLLKDVAYASKIEVSDISFIIDINGFKLTVDVSGDNCVSAINGQSLTIRDNAGGGSLEINGSGMKDGFGIRGLYADGIGSSITVTVPAAVNVTGTSNIGVFAGGKGIVDAKLTNINNTAGSGYVYGLIAYEGGTAHVGNITVNHSGNWCIGVYIYGDPLTHGQTTATVDGTITADEYIRFGTQTVDIEDQTLPTTKTGYRTYKLGSAENANTVWVKIAGPADATPPIWTSGYPFTSYVQDDELGLAVSADETCTVYYVVLADGAEAPSAEQVENRQDAGGNAVPGNSFTYGNPPTAVGHYVGGLTPVTAYDIYVVLKDGAGNLQGEPAHIDVTTLPYFDTVPNDTNSEITDQEQGAAGSKQVTLTVTVRNAAGEAITGIGPGNFEVSIDDGSALTFVDNPPFAGFTDNGDGTYTVVFTGDADRTEYSFTDLTAFGVVIEAGPTTVTTPPAPPSSGGGGISLPSAPLNLRLVSDKDAIHLVWDPVKESIVKGYHVYRSEKGSNHAPVRLTTEPQKDVEYKDRSATIGTTYIYYVVAADIYGRDSLRSNTVEAAPATVRGTLDIPANSWYKDYVEKLLLREVLDGYTDGTFRPNGKITRAEFAKMLCLAMGWEIKNPEKASFPDVAKSSWAYKYIETGATHGVLDGYKEDGTFRPDRFISREEMAKIIAMTLTLPGADSALKDIDTSWAKEFIKACNQAGIINGYPGDNTFRPKNHTTRAEAAAMIARMLKD